jgi:hypothetical protein
MEMDMDELVALRIEVSQLHSHINVLEKEIEAKNNLIGQLQTALLDDTVHHDVSTLDYNTSPCMRAAINGDHESLKMIVDNMDLKANKERLEAVFLKACEHGYLDIIKLLVERGGVDPACDKSSGLLWACSRATHTDIEVAQYLIRRGCDVNAVQSLPMRIAVAKRNVKLMGMLLESGATSS